MFASATVKALLSESAGLVFGDEITLELKGILATHAVHSLTGV